MRIGQLQKGMPARHHPGGFDLAGCDGGFADVRKPVGAGMLCSLMLRARI
jgi:hypothetical protein